MLHEAAGMNLPEVRMRVLKRRRDPAAVNSRLIRRPIQRMFWLFLLPMTAAFCIGFVYPFLKGLFLSFCKFKLTSQWTWVGLNNYVKAFSDSSFLHAFWYTALFAFVSVLFINVLAFAVAYFLTKGIKGSNLFRTVFFMPNLIGGIVLGYIWSMIFDGILVKYNTSVVLESKFGFWGLIILMCWQQVGYMMIIYIAGLQSVPEDMLEAARIDGVGEWNIFFRIFIPSMRSSYATAITMTFMNTWNAFLWPLVIMTDTKKTTMPVFLSVLTDTGYTPDYGAVMLAVAITTFPTLIVFFALQKSFINGMAGSLKG